MEYTLALDNAPETVRVARGYYSCIRVPARRTDSTPTSLRPTPTDSRHLDADDRARGRTEAGTLRGRRVQRHHPRHAVYRARLLPAQFDNIHYVAAPDDLDAIVSEAETFLQDTTGSSADLRLADGIIYYADEDGALSAVEDILDLLDEYDAVGMFHLADEVHDEETVAAFRELFDGVIELSEDGTITRTSEA